MVHKKLEDLKALMDKRGLPHGLNRGEVSKEIFSGVVVREKRFPAGHVHGNILVDSLRNFKGSIYRIMGGHSSMEEFDPDKTVFVDTETTGLSVGAGTYAFLVGAGFFEDGDFVVRQFLMPEPCEEGALLEKVSEEFASFRWVVTFNGLTFDLPLINTRFIMNGLRPSWTWEHHLDLLPIARRLWRGRFESCRLSRLEQGILDFHRRGDIPGERIPSLYLHFLKRKRLSLLEPVLHHNVLDIVSMAALAAHICALVEQGQGLDLSDAWDFDAAGRAFSFVGDQDHALECYRMALQLDIPDDKRRVICRSIGDALKVRGHWEEAREMWELLRSDYSDEYYVRIELSKYYEHRGKEIEPALDAAREALAILDGLVERAGKERSPRALLAATRSRVERLERKTGIRRRGKGEEH